MFRPQKSFITFTRNEKMGLLVLTGLLMLLLIVRVTMHFFVKPSLDEAQQAGLRKAWQQFQQTQSDTVISAKEYIDKNAGELEPMSEVININIADSATLVRLRGIGPVTAHKILEYRCHQHFTDFDEFRKLCRLSAANAALLKPHIVVANDRGGRNK